MLCVSFSCNDEHLFQTLVTLNLRQNRFDALGIEFLADALQENTV